MLKGVFTKNWKRCLQRVTKAWVSWLSAAKVIWLKAWNVWDCKVFGFVPVSSLPDSNFYDLSASPAAVRSPVQPSMKLGVSLQFRRRCRVRRTTAHRRCSRPVAPSTTSKRKMRPSCRSKRTTSSSWSRRSTRTGSRAPFTDAPATFPSPTSPSWFRFRKFDDQTVWQVPRPNPMKLLA